VIVGKGVNALSKNTSMKGTQISPLRCALVEMTKGRAVLPERVVTEREPFYIALDGPTATLSKNISKEG
jgi:hypothetical protein